MSRSYPAISERARPDALYERDRPLAPALRVVASPEARPSDVDQIAVRDREIVALRARGLTLAEIGRAHGLTRQRVAQIVDRSGRVAARDVVRARRTADVRRAWARCGEILELWRQGLNVGEIHDRVGVSWQSVRRTVAQFSSDQDQAARERSLRAKLPSARPPRYSDEQLRDGLRTVAERLGHPPTGPEYDTAARELGLARMVTVYMRSGGWARALRAAGLQSPFVQARTKAPRWHPAACWRALESVADQLGDPPRYQRYAQLAAVRDDLPSAATVRVRLGLWSEIAAALTARGDGDPSAERLLGARLTAPPSNGAAARVRRNGRAASRTSANGARANGASANGASAEARAAITALALRYLAAHPGSSGMAVNRGTGIRHYNQLSTLLAYLEREGVLEVKRNGHANAWTLTERGAALAQELPEAIGE